MVSIKDALERGTPLKAFIYGYGKTRKTSWAGQVAKSNMNGLYCDCDNSVPVLSSTLSPEEQSKLNYLDIGDEVNSSNASWFIAALTKGKPFMWDVDDKKIVKTRVPNHTMFLCNPSLFHSNDLLIIDSYTQVCNSLFTKYAQENGIDLSVADKPEWDNYRWAGQLATFMLSSLMALKCSVIVIGHVKTYEKKAKDKFGKEIILGMRTQPLSVSNPHAETISKFFGEVYYFFKQGTGTKISTKTTDAVDCGSRFLKPQEWNYDDLTFEQVANQYNINNPRPIEAFVYSEPTDSAEVFDQKWSAIMGATAKPSSTTSSSSTPVIKPSSSFLKK